MEGWSGAGHPPVISREQSTGETRDLLENGWFLGCFPDASYTSAEIPFKPGDWGVLYTDGILEMTDPS